MKIWMNFKEINVIKTSQQKEIVPYVSILTDGLKQLGSYDSTNLQTETKFFNAGRTTNRKLL